VKWLKTRRRYSVPLERRSLFAKLRRSGAQETYLKTLRTELQQIENIVAGGEFRSFVQPYIGSLAADQGR
jgi:hypothetical protein